MPACLEAEQKQGDVVAFVKPFNACLPVAGSAIQIFELDFALFQFGLEKCQQACELGKDQRFVPL